MDSTQSTRVCVSGLETHIYGLEDVRKSHATSVDVVFILHGRTQRWQDYEKMAVKILEKDKFAGTGGGNTSMQMKRSLIVVSFDQRNHGHRQVSQLANKTWIDGNELHAQDMYSIQYGTSQDVSLLITFLPHVLFPQSECTFANIIASGISLGGHATYLALSNDDRIAAGVVIIGCPDYTALITQRAVAQNNKDKLLPKSFLDTVARLDPQVGKVSLKDLLILKGDDDPVVPWSASEAFVSRLPPDRAEVVGYPGVGHAFPDVMLEKSADWIAGWRRRR